MDPSDAQAVPIGEWSSPAPLPGQDRARFAQQVRLPGVFISIISGFNALVFTVFFALFLAEALAGRRILGDPSTPPAGIAVAFFTLSIAAYHLSVLLGAIQMLRMKSRMWAQYASIAMLVPCLGPSCIIGIPIGIWSLVSVNNVPREAWG